MRNILGQVPSKYQSMASPMIRTIFVQPTTKDALLQVTWVAESLRTQFPRAAEMLLSTSEDILSYMSFPTEHWRQIHATNPLERLNREIGRRADVVAIFPNRQSVLRLVGAVLMEQNDEWAAATRRYFSQECMAKIYAGVVSQPDAPPALNLAN